MKRNSDPVLGKIADLVENEKNDIGLSKVMLPFLNLRPSATISGSYVIDVKDTRSGFVVPLSHNGLGYNNLINMYTWKLVEIQKVEIFAFYVWKEPETHLHPAMQYKL